MARQKSTPEDVARLMDRSMRAAHLDPENAEDFAAFRGILDTLLDGLQPGGQVLDFDLVAQEAAKTRQYERALAGDVSPHEMAAIGYQAHYAEDTGEASANSMSLFKPAYPQDTEDNPLSPYELAKMGYQKHAEESEG